MRKFSKKDAEFDVYRFLLESASGLDEMLKKRIEASLKYYIDKANVYKQCGNILSVLNIILPAFATFLSAVSGSIAAEYRGYDWISLTVPFTTFATTVVAGLIAYFKCSEKKNAYRNSAESLKNELMLFQCEAGKYNNLSEDKARKLFLVSVEKIIESSYKKIVELEKSRKIS